MKDFSIKINKALTAVPYFEGLDNEIIEAISASSILRTYAAGQVVFLEGEPCTGLYLVQEGWLRSVKISPAGREQVIRFVGPGEAFNEIGVLAGGNNLVTVEALEPAKVWIILHETLLRLMDEHPSLSHVIVQNLAKRVLYVIELVEDLSLRSVESRLAKLLLEQSSGEILHRRKWSTQSEMAARLGTVPDVVNRILRSLVEDGLIQVDRQRIQILDRQSLEEKAMLSG